MGSSDNATAGPNTERYHVPNLERALRVLEHLAGRPEPQGVTDVANALSIPRNSAFRILSTLWAHGYLWRDEDTCKYGLSHKLLALGYASAGQTNLVQIARDVMQDLRDLTQETVLLGMLAGNEGVVLEQVASPQHIKFLVDPGHRFPLHTAAPGKAILAELPEPEQERTLAALTFQRFTERTITSADAMREELDRVRRRGYAVDHGEEIEGLHCVAAAIRDHTGYPRAAIWVTSPAFRLKPEQFDAVGRQVRQHADRISRRLGCDALA